MSTIYLPNDLAWMRVQEWREEGAKPEHCIVCGLLRQLINTQCEQSRIDTVSWRRRKSCVARVAHRCAMALYRPVLKDGVTREI